MSSYGWEGKETNGEFDDRQLNFQSIGPKTTYDSSASNLSPGYFGLYSTFSVLQFLLLLYAAASGSVGLVNFVTTDQAHCLVPCENGDPGPPGENGTCPVVCLNGNNGTNGANGMISASFPGFGQYASNAILDSSSGGISVVSSGGDWIPITNPGGSAFGTFSTNNVSAFSSIGHGFNVLYTGEDNAWVTISLNLIVKPNSFTPNNITYFEVNWQNPADVPFEIGNPKINVVTEGNGTDPFIMYSVSSTVRTKIPTGSTIILWMYTPFLGYDVHFDITQFILLLQQ